MLANEQEGVLKGRCVLVAEDQYLIADDMRRAVVRLGGEVLGPAGRVSTASEMARQRTPDLALLDINLHGETIYALAEELRARKVPLIFTTGYGRPDIRPDFADAVRLEKPFSIESLADAARALGMAL